MADVIARLREEKKYPAARIYRSTLNSFMAFAAEESGDTLVDDVYTPGRLKAYQCWLRGRRAKWNTVSTYMRSLHAVYNRLCVPGSAEYNPKLFDDVYTKVESKTKRALEKEEMELLVEEGLGLLSRTEDVPADSTPPADPPLPTTVQCALAYFVLMFCLRGMPFIDLAYLRKQDLEGDTITYCRHKTGRQITLRIPPEAIGLFEAFRNKDARSTWLFPILDVGKTDDARLYEYYLKALHRFNHQLSQVAALLLPGVRLSSYTSRHTWATLAFRRGIHIGVISRALGHSSVKVTETYLKPFEDAKVDAANADLIVSLGRKERGKVLNSGQAGQMFAR